MIGQHDSHVGEPKRRGVPPSGERRTPHRSGPQRFALRVVRLGGAVIVHLDSSGPSGVSGPPRPRGRPPGSPGLTVAGAFPNGASVGERRGRGRDGPAAAAPDVYLSNISGGTSAPSIVS